MKNIVYLLIIFVLSSCIEITQEIQLKKNLSGSVVYTVDMSKMKDIIESLKSLGNSSNDSGLGNADKQFSDYAKSLKNIQGISKVKLTTKKFVYTIYFDFNNIDALNKALTLLNSGKGSLEQNTIEYIKVENNQIIVRNSNQINSNSSLFKLPDNTENQQEGNEMGDTIVQENETQEKQGDEEIMKALFTDATYTTVLKLYKNVVSNSHPNAKVSGKKVTLKLPILDLDKKENAQNIITIK